MPDERTESMLLNLSQKIRETEERLVTLMLQMARGGNTRENLKDARSMLLAVRHIQDETFRTIL